MTYAEHAKAIHDAAKDYYMAVHTACNENIDFNPCFDFLVDLCRHETNPICTHGVYAFHTSQPRLIEGIERPCSATVEKLQFAIFDAGEALAKVLNSAAKDNYSFEVHGSVSKGIPIVHIYPAKSTITFNI